jgi:hypothetical protein
MDKAYVTYVVSYFVRLLYLPVNVSKNMWKFNAEKNTCILKKHELSVREKDNYRITRKVVGKYVCTEFYKLN